MADNCVEQVLPIVNCVDHSVGLFERVLAHCGLGVELAESERHTSNGRQLGVLIEHASERVVEYCAVVDARAHHDLAMHGDAVIEQRA